MQTERRLGKIEIEGKEYPLNYCMRNAAEINEILADKSGKSDFDTMAKNLRILWLLMRDGAAYMTQMHGDKATPICSEETLQYILAPGDNPRIVAAVKEAIELGGVRLVEVAAKKAAAVSEGTRA